MDVFAILVGRFQRHFARISRVVARAICAETNVDVLLRAEIDKNLCRAISWLTLLLAAQARLARAELDEGLS